MLRTHRNTESGLDVAIEFIGLLFFAAVVGGVYHLLVGLAAHIRPVLS